MKHSMKSRLLALVLLACVLTGVACAQAAGLDSILAGFLDSDEAVRFSMSLQMDTWMPFPEDTIVMLNSLLKHMVFTAAVEQDEGSSLTTIGLSMAGHPLMTLSEREESGEYRLQTDLLPNRTLEGTQSPMDALSGAAPSAGGSSFDLFTAIEETETHYPALFDALEPLLEKKKANYKIKGVGSSKWSQIARLSPEESDTVAPLLRAVLQCGMDEAYRAELESVTFGKQFVVALYQTEENGDDLAIYMKGNLIYPDQSVRKLSYQWAFSRSDAKRNGTYKYEAIASGKNPSNRVINGSYALSQGDTPSTNVTVDTSFKAEGITDAQMLKCKISGKKSDASKTLEGEVSLTAKHTESGDTSTTVHTLSPNMTLTAGTGGTSISGSAQWVQKNEKTPQTAMTITFAPVEESALQTAPQSTLYEVGDESLPAGASFAQNVDEAPENDFLVGSAPVGMKAFTAPEVQTAVNIDSLTQAQKDDLLEEISQHLAARAMRSLLSLPAEDLAFLQQGMTETDFAQFLSILESL